MKLQKYALSCLLILFMGVAIAYAGWKTDYSELDEELSSADAVLIVDQSAGATKYVEAHNLYRQDIVKKTGAYTLLTDDGGRTFTNTGASASITLTCLECTSAIEGWSVTVMNTAGYAVVIDPHANDSFADQSDGEAGEYVSISATKGSQITFVCVEESNSGTEEDEYNWFTQGYVGVLTTED